MAELADTVGAFVPGPRVEVAPTGDGSLSGLTFATKDLFDVAGAVTTYGNPDWARTHPPAVATASTRRPLAASRSTRSRTAVAALSSSRQRPSAWQGRHAAACAVSP